MSLQEKIRTLRLHLHESLADQSFVKLTLGHYKGKEPQLKNIYFRKVIIREEEKLSLTYRYQTRDIVKNYTFKEALAILEQSLHDGFQVANLMTTVFNEQLEVMANGKVVLRKQPSTQTRVPDASHDKVKKRHIESGNKPYLHDLNITNAEGIVLKDGQDKYKQINHYIELLRTMLEHLPKEKELHIVDMGSGKGYLTFALYDYLQTSLKLKVKLTGVEFRSDLVKLCNELAVKNQFDHLSFVEGSIQNYDVKAMDVLIALHACDTATDDAIFKGIQANAQLIVVAPCCHKQIRREMEQHAVSNELDFILRYGIYLEREAEMITDSLRALLLEYAGYKTKIFEFISQEHTPKNCMIVAEKTASMTEEKKIEIVGKIEKAKAYFGIRHHHLETLLGI